MCKRTLIIERNGNGFTCELHWEGGRLWRHTFLTYPNILIDRLACYDLTIIER